MRLDELRYDSACAAAGWEGQTLPEHPVWGRIGVWRAKTGNRTHNEWVEKGNYAIISRDKQWLNLDPLMAQCILFELYPPK